MRSDFEMMLCRNHLILILTLLGALPPPLGHPVAIVPYYLYRTVKIFSVPIIQRHRNMPSPPRWGQGWRKGVIILEKVFNSAKKPAEKKLKHIRF
jgi:hypothetical protein